MLNLGSNVLLTKQPREPEPGYVVDSFPKAMRDQYLKSYREKYPPRAVNADSMRAVTEERYLAPPGYNDTLDHMRNFLSSMRTRKLPVEDAVFGYRAAGPALLANLSYFEKRVCNWDPEQMKMVA